VKAAESGMSDHIGRRLAEAESIAADGAGRAPAA
jgi:hypothetical protein